MLATGHHCGNITYEGASTAGLQALYLALAAMPNMVMCPSFFCTSAGMAGFYQVCHSAVSNNSASAASLYAAACLLGLCQAEETPDEERSATYFQLADNSISTAIQVS